jgi:hypothetical protein
MPELPDDTDRGPHHLRSGAGSVIFGLYAVMALAATGRSTVQIAEYFHRAPVAYVLSALAAVIYLVAVVALARGGWTALRVATVSCTVELVGVLAVGTWSYAQSSAFPDKTVWSHFGQGYGYLPLVLPVLGLWWLRRNAVRTDAARGPAAG